jgi:hypothetical protein
MNDVYFGCTKCKTYVDAGYRWAYCELEKRGVVVRSEVVNIDRLLLTHSYWKPEPNENNAWLTSTLAHAEKFLLGHRTHLVVYGDMEQLVGANSDEYEQFAWMNENPNDIDLRPRNFIEQMEMTTWGDVESHLALLPRKPWWYQLRSVRLIARRKFEHILLSRRIIPPRLE